jgi:uncharacterized protein (DUF58 family)
MRVFPDGRLLGALGSWTLLCAAAVVLPALLPVVVGGLGLLGVLLAWDARLLALRPPLEAERLLPARVFAGRAGEIVLRIANGAAAPRQVSVIDELPMDLADPEPRFAAVVVPARAEARLAYPIRPQVRGDRELGPVLLLERSPLGLLRRRMQTGAGTVVRVHPDTSRFLQPDALDARRLLSLLGARPARRRGDGLEFESLRDFVDGDDPRHVDWAASARRGRPVLRLYEHEQHHSIVLAVDRSRLMGGRSGLRTKLDFAVDAALALGFASLAAGDRVGLVVFDRRVEGRLAPRRHRRSLGALADVLCPVQPALVEADYAALVRDLAVHQRERALVVVLTDFVEASSASLAGPIAVLARRHRVLLVAIRDPLLATFQAGDAAASAAGAFPIERRIVLDDLLREREATLAGLRRRGVESLDLPPEGVTTALLNRYLALREENW